MPKTVYMDLVTGVTNEEQSRVWEDYHWFMEAVKGLQGDDGLTFVTVMQPMVLEERPRAVVTFGSRALEASLVYAPYRIHVGHGAVDGPYKWYVDCFVAPDGDLTVERVKSYDNSVMEPFIVRDAESLAAFVKTLLSDEKAAAMDHWHDDDLLQAIDLLETYFCNKDDDDPHALGVYRLLNRFTEHLDSAEAYKAYYDGTPAEDIDLVEPALDGKGYITAAILQGVVKALGRPITVLDVGCCKGHMTMGLALTLKDSVSMTGVDVSNVAIEGAWRSLTHWNKTHPEDALIIEYVEADAQDLSVFPDKSFDVVLHHQILEHVRNVNDVLAEGARVAKVLELVSVPYGGVSDMGRPLQIGVACSHVRHVDVYAMAEELQAKGYKPLAWRIPWPQEAKWHLPLGKDIGEDFLMWRLDGGETIEFATE
jgi:SAM-dependent methyltransferase